MVTNFVPKIATDPECRFSNPEESPKPIVASFKVVR